MTEDRPSDIFIDTIRIDTKQRAIEQDGAFVFETTFQMKISKKILIRALECFRNEHAEEYTILMEEMEKEESDGQEV